LYRERDEKKRKRFIDFKKSVRKNRLVFVDESGIDRYFHREYCRTKRGEQIFENVPGKKFSRQSIVAAKCEDRIIAPFGYDGTCSSELFLDKNDA
jgi:hypothetical protein